MAYKHGLELPHTKLGPDDLEEIYSAKRQREKLRAHIESNLSNKALAEKFGVHVSTVEKYITVGISRGVL
jgi:transposase